MEDEKDKETWDQASEQAEVKEETQQSLEELKSLMIPDIAKKLYEGFVKTHSEAELIKENITIESLKTILMLELKAWEMSGPFRWKWMINFFDTQKWSDFFTNISHTFKNPFSLDARSWLQQSTKQSVDQQLKTTWTELREIKDAVELEAFAQKMWIKQKKENKEKKEDKKSEEEDEGKHKDKDKKEGQQKDGSKEKEAVDEDQKETNKSSNEEEEKEG